jgi:signal transduction histidine kinase/CheY-like chemotaxis protein
MQNLEARRPLGHPDARPVRLESNLDAFPHPAILIDVDDRILGWNAAAAELFRKPVLAALGRRLSDLALDDALIPLRPVLDEARRTSAPVVRRPARLRLADGETRAAAVTAAPVADDAGRIVAALIVVDTPEAPAAVPVTDRRELEFLAMLAHELRNPLAPIVAAMHVMRLESRDVRTQQIRHIVERQIRHLTRLVDDLLDVSRITLGKIDLHPVPVDLAVAVGDAVEAARHLVRMGGQALRVHMPPTPIVIMADPTRATQVVSNLLSNAAKYTPPGGEITVSGAAVGGEAVITVKDTGIGIAPEMIDRIFDLFTQVDSSLAHSRGGVGIGLTLVKRLVELHGGRVEAKSAGLGSGSEFIVHWPLATRPPEAATRPAPDHGAVRGLPRRVLVVEDSRDAREMLKMALELEGHRVAVARHGNEGVEIALSLKPDAAVVDIGLPGADGYEVARELRRRLGDRVLLVALSGYGDRESQLRALGAGFDVHLVKPVDPEQLLRVLGTVAGD